MKTFRVLLLLTVAVSAIRADVVKTVTLDTAGLGILPGGPFSLAFELADGTGSGDGNNSVVLSDFQFGFGGSPSASPLFTLGAVLGDLSSTVTLTDADVANVFVQDFVAGDTLSFLLSFTTNVDAGTPDEFIFSILDSSLNPLPTSSASPLSPFLAIDLDSANPAILTFDGIGVPAPTVADAPSAVPEPSSAALLIIPLVAFVWAGRRKIGLA
ncbi:MAG: NF038129 family PEP-CTERM protein [Acidobacteriia bacterium]|nr:NF038129 family PEP-CTERM protein [Terriglobia bacterium]